MDDADPDDEDGPGVPLAVHLVRLAGVLWVGHGVLLLTTGALVWYEGLLAEPSLGVIAVLFGAMLSAAGLLTATGRTDDPDGPAIVSSVLALVAAATAAAIYRPAQPGDWIIAASAGGYAVSLALPSVLVLAGRRDYLAWRARRFPDPPPK